MMPNGIQKMSNDIEGLVQTSLNLGILKTTEDEVTASFSVRSSVQSEKENLIDQLRCVSVSAGGSLDVQGIILHGSTDMILLSEILWWMCLKSSMEESLLYSDSRRSGVWSFCR